MTGCVRLRFQILDHGLLVIDYFSHDFSLEVAEEALAEVRTPIGSTAIDGASRGAGRPQLHGARPVRTRGRTGERGAGAYLAIACGARTRTSCTALTP